MGLKQRIEENAVVWFLASVVAAFGTGIAAYEGILRIADRTTISNDLKSALERSAARAEELEATVNKLKAMEGKAPRNGSLLLTSDIARNAPVDTLGAAKLGSDPYLYVRWVGLTPGGYYAQHLELRDSTGKLMHENDYPFVANESTQNMWHSIFFDPQFYSAGNYRVRYLLNGEEVLETGIVVEPETR